MLRHHPDKADPADEARIHELNDAKDACLERIVSTRYVRDEQEFIRHICRILEEKLDCPSDIDFSHMIGPRLHDFMHIRAVDAMGWVIWCSMGDVEFDQKKEDEIPILCKYYDSFIGRDNWTDKHNTIMTVLTKYVWFKSHGFVSCAFWTMQAA